VPAYNKTLPAKGLNQPPILKPDALWGDSGGPAPIHAYTLAAKIPARSTSSLLLSLLQDRWGIRVAVVF